MVPRCCHTRTLKPGCCDNLAARTAQDAITRWPTIACKPRIELRRFPALPAPPLTGAHTLHLNFKRVLLSLLPRHLHCMTPFCRSLLGHSVTPRTRVAGLRSSNIFLHSLEHNRSLSMTSGKRGPLDQYFTRTAAPSSKKVKAAAADGPAVRIGPVMGLQLMVLAACSTTGLCCSSTALTQYSMQTISSLL